MSTRNLARAIVIGSALATAGVSHAMDPVATSLQINHRVVHPSTSFAEYSGTKPIGEVNKNKLFFIDEQESAGVKSWYIFFDPACKGVVDAEITFSNAITGLITKSSELLATRDDYDIIYGDAKHPGLEKRDYASYFGNTLKIHWHAGGSGDGIRVMTAVPEPQTYALLLAGLGVMTLVARRRKAQPSPTPA